MNKPQLINFCEFDKYAEKSYCAVHNTDKSLNLGDITKVNEKEIADFNMMVGGSPCFKAGTLITTDSGLKNIEDICVGDLVLTHTNKLQKVLKIGNKHSQDIYKVKVQGSPITYVTSEHPYYVVERNWKFNSSTRSNERLYSEPKWKTVKDLKKSDFVAIGKNMN